MDLVKSSTKQEIRIITKKFKSATIANAKISNSQSKPLIIIKSNKTDLEFKQDDINPKTIAAVRDLKGKNTTDTDSKETKNGAIKITLKTVS